MKITGLDEERHGRRWNGQRALVTGAGQGIGQAVAQLLASKGVKVAVNDIVPERAENTVKLIADAGGEAFAAIGDIADPTVVEDLFRQLDYFALPRRAMQGLFSRIPVSSTPQGPTQLRSAQSTAASATRRTSVTAHPPRHGPHPQPFRSRSEALLAMASRGRLPT